MRAGAGVNVCLGGRTGPLDSGLLGLRLENKTQLNQGAERDRFHLLISGFWAHLLLYFVLSVQSCFNGVEELVLVDEAVRPLLPGRGRRSRRLQTLQFVTIVLQTPYLIIGTTKV